MNLILYLVQVTCCLAFFYGFYHLILRKETLFETNRLYLVITLASSIVLPLIKIYVDAQTSESPIGIGPYVYVGSYVDAISTNFAVAKTKPFPWDRLIVGIYALGIAIMAIRLLNALKEIQWIRQYGLKTMVNGQRCILSDQVKSPFSFFNTIYFPKQHQFGDIELKEIVAHELAHVKGRHTLDVLFMETACILLWPSPLIYFYRKALKDVHEYVADAAVIRDTPWENYAQLLIGQQQGQLQNILSNQLIYSQLKKRLLMMNKERSGTMAGLKYLGIIPVLLIALVLFSFREKNASDKETNLFNNEVLSDRIIHLSIAADRKIYYKMTEIPKEDLESFLRKQISITNDTLLYVRLEKTLRVDAMIEIDSVGQKVKIHTIFDMGEQTDYSHLKTNTSYTFSEDTVPELGIISLRLTEPSMENANGLILEDQSSTGESQKLDYTMSLPIFPGCDDVLISERGQCGMIKLGEYLNKNLVYPQTLKSRGIEGNVMVKFVVGSDGYIKDVAIHKSLHPDADQVVLTLFQEMNSRVGKWRPVRKEGKSYDAEMILPVNFSLDGEPVDAEPLIYAEELPRFPGCEDIEDEVERSSCASRKMFEFIYTNINYPKKDKDNNIEGIVLIQFVIEVDGSISDINVRRSPSETMKQEVIRLMNLMAALPEQWIPARQDGRKVAMQFTLPVRFSLKDDRLKVMYDNREKDSPTSDSDESLVAGKTITVVPNPATESISVELIEGTHTINIFNLSGNLVLTNKVSSRINVDKESVNVSSLPSGQYAVQVLSSTGSATGSFTIVK